MREFVFPERMKALRYLIAFTAHNQERLAEEEAYIARLRGMGYDVEGFCVSVPLPGPALAFSQLDHLWQTALPDLMRMYEALEEKLRTKDVFVLWTGANVHPEFVAKLSTYNVYVCSDDPESSDAFSRPVARYFDYAFTRNIACVEMYRDWGCANVKWLCAPADPRLRNFSVTADAILKEPRDLDTVIICEREYGISDRARRIDRLMSRFPQTYARGKGWPGGYVSLGEVYDAYSRAKVGWNFHNSIGPTNSRLIALPACGVLQICDNKENLGKIFRLDEEVIGFDTLDECIEQTAYFLAHDDERRRVAARGWERATTDYTEQRQWERVLEAIAPDCLRKLDATRGAEDRVTIVNPSYANGYGLQLHLGCGNDYKPGYLNVDLNPMAHADIHASMLDLEQFVRPNSVQLVETYHALNYLSLWEARQFFRILHRLFQDEGLLVIETANVESLARKILESSGNLSEYLEGVRGLHAFGLDHLAQELSYSPNKFSWTPWHLVQELQAAGFMDVTVQPAKTHAPWRDMRIEARKRTVNLLNRCNPAPTDRRPGSVLFVLDPLLGHTTVHVRGLMHRERLAEAGWRAEFVDLREVGEERVVELAQHFEATYLLKVASLSLVRKLKERTRTKVVFDLTDALWQPFHRAHGWHDLEAILEASDAVFSENEYVCAFGLKHNPRVYSIPASTQPHLFDAARASMPPRTDDKVIIGWVGSNGTVSALDTIREPLRRLCSRHPNVELRIVGCSEPHRLAGLAGLPYSVRPTYDEAGMIDEIVRMDIGVFPPPLDLDDYRIRGAQKGMLYMTAGIPAVCQNAGDCARVIADGKTGMLADSLEDWFEKLDTLVASPDLRRRMGAAASQSIRPGHTYDHVFSKLHDALCSVIHDGGSDDLPHRPRPRILLIADVPNWIFARHCEALKRHLSDEFEFHVAYRGDPFREDDFDLIYPLEWNLLTADQIGTPSKYVTGIRSHISWHALDFSVVVAHLRQHYQAIHVVSRRLEEVFAESLPVHYVTHGLNTAFFTPTTSSDQGGHQVRLGWAGNRKSPAKGFEAFVEPLGDLPGVELAFCGYSDQHLTPEGVRDFYDSLDIYVCSSETEGNNNALLEAACMGRAIVTTDNGTVPEYLQDEVSALIVPRELPAFVAAVQRLQADPDLRRRLGGNARRAVLERWDWRDKAQDYRRFFWQALTESGYAPGLARVAHRTLNVACFLEPEQDPSHLLASFLLAFQPSDPVALHILGPEPPATLHARILACLERRGLAPSDIPDVELYDVPTSAPDFHALMLAADLVIGPPAIAEAARGVGLPAWEDATPQRFQALLHSIRELEWRVPALEKSAPTSEYWGLPFTGNWQAPLEQYLRLPVTAPRTLAILVGSNEGIQAYAALEEWLLAHGYDPTAGADLEIIEVTPETELAAYRMCAGILETGSPRMQALAQAVGRKVVFPNAGDLAGKAGGTVSTLP